MVTIREASKNFKLKRKYLEGGVIDTVDETSYSPEDIVKLLQKRDNKESLTTEEIEVLEKYDLKQQQQYQRVANNTQFGTEIASNMLNTADSLVMGDKNFSPQSAAIDSAVHGASSALMKSGNPYAALAGVALEGANFLTKAGGQTVEGFNVDINNQGYGTLGSMDSHSSRNFLGLGNRNVKNRLAKRNEQARMALNAAAISEEQEFNNIAANNSVDNVIRQNKVALAGGIDNSLLAN